MIAYSMGHSAHSLYVQSIFWLKEAASNSPKKRTMYLSYNLVLFTSLGVTRTGQALVLLWRLVGEPGERRSLSLAERVMKRFITYSSN